MRLSFLFAGALLTGTCLQAQTYTAPLVGFNAQTCLANSDTLVSVPFSRPPDFVGAISAVSSSTLTISGTTGWQDGQYVYGTALTAGGTQHNTYYALIGPRPIALAGTVSLVSGTNTVTGSGTGFTTAISAGDGLVLTGTTSGYFVVASVTDDTHLVITNNAPTTLSAQTANVSKSVKEGRTYVVTANTTVSGVSTVTLNLNGDTISSIVAGTQIALIPYWTLATVFPPSDLGVSYIGSGSVRTVQTQILLPNYSTTGINISAAAVYYYSTTASEWQLAGGPTANSGDTILLPDGYFTIRNAATATTLTSIGSVNDQRLSIQLTSGTSSSQQDNFVSITRPLPVALRDLNLVASGAFTPTTAIRNVQDQLFLYNNAATGINKSASAVYFYMNGIWQLAGGTLNADAGSTTIPAGAAILIRKGGTTGSTVFWANQPTY
jgi:uncharacterized protein (TIGR02597 family)